ncbi:MAG TPA: AAA family ATPase [Longimicrobium sp.]|nr:AAA family ATPase [Longimicrobium sp.]
MAAEVLQPALPPTQPVRIRADRGDEMEIPPDALVVLVGPSGCGKSTFARRWFGETEVVSSDECRRLVSDNAASQAVSREAFAVFYAILRGRMSAGRVAVADATSLTPWSRQRLRQIAGARGRPVVAVAFDAPLSLCLARQHLRQRRVPPEVVEGSFGLFRQALQELPHEGYARLYVVEPPAGALEDAAETEDLIPP